MNLDDESVRGLLKLIGELDFTELTIETADARIHVSRAPSTGAGGATPPTWRPRERMVEAERSGDRASAGPVPTTAPAPAHEDADVVEVRAPMLGTFYRAPKPGDPPFVSVGDVVAEDTVIGIIEVMKLMNSVIARARGAVSEICAADGEMVQAGDVLVKLRPGGEERG